MDKKEQILVAAMDLLIEHGVQGTPMSAIAKAAGAGMGTIYNYFPTKEDLINAIYIHIKQDEVKTINVPLDNDSIKKNFEHFCAALVRYMVDKPKHYWFMDQFQSSPIITEATREEGRKVFGDYVAVIMKGQAQGLIKPISIEELMQFLNGGLMGFVRWILATGMPLTDAMLATQLRIAWDAIKE